MEGTYEVIAGTGSDGSIDGPGELASFRSPNGIAVSGDTLL